ncbi:MAG TPA: T9SS type A sorting domain-containing protein, partial [Catalimonadaceae bacterium]|nr:T9SS type A sorting domain-containing protein [Catalimonadaceae bacterium]
GPGWLQLANPQAGYVYNWIINGQPQSGNPINPILYSGSSAVQFTAVAPNGCVTEMDQATIFTGNKDESTRKTRLLLFPNPGNGLVHIAGVESGPAQIRLTGMDGKVYMERILHDSENTFNTKGLPAGIYWLELKNQHSGFREQLKFVQLAD